MDVKFIPTAVHGVLDYIVAVALFFAPVIFGFQELGGAAVIIPMVLGIGLFVYSLLTRYELGLFKVIPMPIHLAIDYVAAAFLALSPFLFGFINEAPNAWMPHIVVGLAVLLVTVFTQTVPSRSAVES
ncbi:MAG: Membrane protein [Candidatus Saccharibacteria bacterium]|nr:Membrane protein [Candidatus Saccharibacteria bacterium]